MKTGVVEVSPVDGTSTAASALDVIERGLAWTQDYDADSSSAFTSTLGADDAGGDVYVVLVWSEDLGGNAGGSSGWKDGSTAVSDA